MRVFQESEAAQTEEMGFTGKLRCIQFIKMEEAIPRLALQIHGVLGTSCVAKHLSCFYF